VVIHGSYDRIFGTPPFENLAGVGGAIFTVGWLQLPVCAHAPANYWEAGSGRVQSADVALDAFLFYSALRDAKDDDLLLEYRRQLSDLLCGKRRFAGCEGKAFSIAALGRFSGYLMLPRNSLGIGRPVSHLGRLFLDNGRHGAHSVARSVFPITQGQRNAGARVACGQQINRPRVDRVEALV